MMKSQMPLKVSRLCGDCRIAIVISAMYEYGGFTKLFRFAVAELFPVPVLSPLTEDDDDVSTRLLSLSPRVTSSPTSLPLPLRRSSAPEVVLNTESTESPLFLRMRAAGPTSLPVLSIISPTGNWCDVIKATSGASPSLAIEAGHVIVSSKMPG